jgi:hypothetical protein
MSYEYETQLREDIVSYLREKMGSDHFIEAFWSDDILEATAFLGDRRQQMSKNPYILVTIPTVDVEQTLAAQTDVIDNVEILLWIASRNTHDEKWQTEEASRAVLLAMSYLSRTRFGLDFTSDETIRNWNRTIEYEDDEHVIYSLRGTLNVDVDLQSVINNYENQ